MEPDRGQIQLRSFLLVGLVRVFCYDRCCEDSGYEESTAKYAIRNYRRVDRAQCCHLQDQAEKEDSANNA